MAEGAGLRRIARPAPPAEAATPARALRQAFARAADRAAGLALVVMGVTEETAPLDELVGRLGDGLLLLLVERDGPRGLLAVDPEARAALVESQTLGRALAQAADPRPATAVDAALVAPVGAAFLAETEAATVGTPLEGWVGAARIGARLPSRREAALALPDGRYRAVRMTLDLGIGGRQGLAVLMLPPAEPAQAAAPARTWTDGLARQVMGSGVALTAVLDRRRMTLMEAERLAPGDLLPLPGVTVASVRLVGPGGADLGPGRLGQVAGMRAVRIEAPPPPALAPAPLALDDAPAWDADAGPAWEPPAEPPAWEPPAEAPAWDGA